MTKVKDILSIDLEDDIKSVVDIDTTDENEDDKIDELNDFILTEALAKHLMDFCDYYSSETRQPEYGSVVSTDQANPSSLRFLATCLRIQLGKELL